MKKIGFLILSILLIGLTTCSTKKEPTKVEDPRLVTHIVDPTNGNLKFYWKNKSGEHYANFKNLKSALEKDGKELTFAVNGGMFTPNFFPQGLFIENGILQNGLNSKDGNGNFYMHPNGIFYLKKDNTAVVSQRSDFQLSDQITYATQSGPMLVINGKIHPKLTDGSKNLHIRNGVGILPSGEILFAMSKEKINFYDLASFFKSHGCQNALYLDGFVSKTYLPSKNQTQTDGNFGVIIAETK